MSDVRSAPFLRTFGMTTVSGISPSPNVSLRTKDLALLVYLAVERDSTHTRSALASLLWGERDQEHARHSLTQSLRRLRLALPHDTFAADDRVVAWQHRVACDVDALEPAAESPTTAAPGLPIYAGEFLADLSVGAGAHAFTQWMEERRTRFRFLAGRVIEAQGNAAEVEGRWDDALKLGHRLIEIEPMSQQAHRRVMRSWGRLGEAALAVRHYHQFARWLEAESGQQPDPATRTLFEQLHAGVGGASERDPLDPHGTAALDVHPLSGGATRAGRRGTVLVMTVGTLLLLGLVVAVLLLGR